MKTKPISQLTESQLLDQIDKVLNRDKLTEYIDETGYFISLYNIKPGKSIVGIKLLYRLYRTWSKKPVHYTKFRTDLSQYILIYKGKYVRLSIDALNITKETYKYLIQQEHVTTNKEKVKYIEETLKFYSIEPGVYWVSYTSLYRVARHFMRFKFKKQLDFNKTQFISYMKLFLPYKYTTDHMFRINELGRTLLQDEVKRINELDEKVKNKKKQGKVSRIKTPFKS